jgi:hypothetical protein
VHRTCLFHSSSSLPAAFYATPQHLIATATIQIHSSSSLPTALYASPRLKIATTSIQINSSSSPPIINKSNNNSNSFENLQKHKLIKNKKNNLKLLITNSLYSGENDISNFFLKNNKEFN